MLPRLAFVISTSFTLLVTVWMASVIFVDNEREERNQLRQLRSMELKQTILHLHEVLTMSARMATSTGDPRWEQRYESFQPQLADAIEEALSVLPDLYQVAGVQFTADANAKLVDMERQAFELVRDGRSTEARDLLFGQQYEKQSQNYAMGMTRFADVKGKTLRLMELQGIIMHLDEVLTMSATMAAVTGDERWEDRYNEYEPRLDFAIREASELVPDLLRGDTAHKTEQANKALVAMEVRAFGFVRAGHLQQAQQLLFGSEYEEQKATYKVGMTHLGVHLRSAAGAERARNNQRSLWKLCLVASLLPVLLACWLMLWRAFRERELGLEGEALLRLNALEAVANAILITDPAGHIQWVNPSFTTLTGFSAAESTGQTPSMLSSGQHPREFFEDMWKILLRGETYRGEVVNRHKDGTEYPARLLIAPVTGADGTIMNFVSVMEDDSDRKAFQDALVDAKESAELSNQTKSEFLANISHEIRTPVHGILGLTQVLLDDQLNEEQREHADSIASCGQTLLILINDLLDLSKLDGGAMELEIVPTDLRALVDDVCATLSPLADDRGNRIAVDYPSEEGQYALVDPVRLRQVLLNLVGNAVKFTSCGKIKIVVRWRQDIDENSILHVEVNDTGVGIPAGQLDTIFERFVQGEGATTRKFGGSGLGLTISKELVELMSGSIGVKHLAVGTSFFIDVPLELCAAPALVNALAKSTQQPDLAGLRVLVAEDNKVNQTITRRMLAKLGCEAVLVEDGGEAAERVLSEQFDVVLMDCMMPTVDGYQGSRRIRQAESEAGGVTKRIPIIALTARAMSGDRELCLEAGMDDYLSKPLTLEDLARMLATWLPAARTSQKKTG